MQRGMAIREWVLVGAALSCWGCGATTAEEIEEHRQEWLAKQPQAYVIEICGTGLDCCCELSAVSAGEVTAARTAFRGQPFQDVAPGQVEPVNALFDRAVSAARADSCELSGLSFDATYSYVSQYSVDCGEEGGGEKVACFKPNTVDLSECAE